MAEYIKREMPDMNGSGEKNAIIRCAPIAILGEERLKMAQDYIAEHHFMRVRDYEAMTYLPHSTAANELRDFCVQPTGITSEVRGNTKVYVKRVVNTNE